MFPGGLVQGGKRDGKLASIRDIKDGMSVGQDYASQIQHYLKTLQASLSLVGYGLSEQLDQAADGLRC